MPFPRPDIGPHPALISCCPTCLRKSVGCPQCGRQSVDDNDGHLPSWCRWCGADLRTRNGDGEESLTDLIRPAFRPGSRSPRTVALIALAVFCGLVASYLTSRVLPRGPEAPPPVIVRGSYSIRQPHSGWRFDEERWRIEQADLTLEGKGRGGRGEFFIVHVVRSSNDELTLEEMVRQINTQWPLQVEGCQFLSQPEPTTVAGQPALRLVAVSKPYAETTSEHNAGDRLRREAVVLVQGRVGYRLTCETNEARFESKRDDFKSFVASFTLIEAQ